MKSARAKQLFFALVVLLLASLSCSSLAGPSPATEQPVEVTSTTAASVEPTQPPEPTPTSTSTPKPELGEIILDEQFADGSNNWYVGADTTTENIIEDGKYKVRVLVLDNSFYWFTPPVSISEVDVTVDTEFTEGAPENAAYGVLCHFKDVDNYYRFRIAPDGTYAIDKSVNTEVSFLADWTKSNAIKQGIGTTNQIHVICSENHLTLYVNDSFVADVVDTSISGGSFQLVIGAYTNKENDKNPVGVSFSNLMVRKPLAWERPTEAILTDAFDDNNNGWDVFEEADGSGQIENGKMVMKVNAADSVYRVWTGITLSNVDMSFDAVIQEGDPANVAYGVACRYINNDNYYSFNMDGTSSYTLKKKVAGTLETLVDWSSSNAIKTGLGETNHVRIVCSSSDLELYVNEQLLVSSQDANLTGGGFALQAGRFESDNKPMSVAFDNIEVNYPEK